MDGNLVTQKDSTFLWENVSQNLSSYKSQFTNIVNMMDIKITVKLVGLSLLKYRCPMRLN